MEEKVLRRLKLLKCQIAGTSLDCDRLERGPCKADTTQPNKLVTAEEAAASVPDGAWAVVRDVEQNSSDYEPTFGACLGLTFECDGKLASISWRSKLADTAFLEGAGVGASFL